MKNFRSILLALSLLVVASAHSQSLKEDFGNDVLGDKGLRDKHCKVGRKKEALIDGKSLLGKTRDEIVQILGEPNRSEVHATGKKGKHKQEEMYYLVWFGEPNSKAILLVLSNDKVIHSELIAYNQK